VQVQEQVAHLTWKFTSLCAISRVFAKWYFWTACHKKFTTSKTWFLVLSKFKITFYAPIGSVVNITMLTNEIFTVFEAYFLRTTWKITWKTLQANAPLVPALPQIRDFQECFIMVLEGFSRSSKLNLWPMHSSPNTLTLTLDADIEHLWMYSLSQAPITHLLWRANSAHERYGRFSLTRYCNRVFFWLVIQDGFF